ncbi:hypothetical protein EON62_06310, partial [archaeon]
MCAGSGVDGALAGELVGGSFEDCASLPSIAHPPSVSTQRRGAASRSMILANIAPGQHTARTDTRFLNRRLNNSAPVTTQTNQLNATTFTCQSLLLPPDGAPGIVEQLSVRLVPSASIESPYFTDASYRDACALGNEDNAAAAAAVGNGRQEFGFVRSDDWANIILVRSPLSSQSQRPLVRQEESDRSAFTPRDMVDAVHTGGKAFFAEPMASDDPADDNMHHADGSYDGSGSMRFRATERTADTEALYAAACVEPAASRART